MTLLPKPLQEEKHSYYSMKTKPDLVEAFKEVFTERQDGSFRLSGKFISDNEFYIASKNAMFFSDSGSSGHNVLKGKINNQDGKVIVDIVLKPVPRIYIETFAPLLFGLIYLFYLIFSSASITFSPLLYSAILIIIVPFIVLFLGQAAKDKLRKKIVAILKLTNI